ncbi:MAG TPA: cytochrome c [Candidatus Binataceae bacterium]|nr:cytochrome c [Candidatus Binataceae bacterium]
MSRLTLPAVLITLLLVGAPSARAQPATQADQGHQLFEQHCASCHGNDGRGNGFAITVLAMTGLVRRPVDFTNAAAMKRWTDEQLAQVIGKGGKATGKSSAMPAYGDKLTAHDIADLVVYIRSLSK